MDYLHGDVVDGQFRAACQYEYARESNTLRRAAESLSRDPSAHTGEISFKIENEFHCGSWFIGDGWDFRAVDRWTWNTKGVKKCEFLLVCCSVALWKPSARVSHTN
jgi:hypothetical protein